MKHIDQLKVSFAGETVGVLAVRQRQYWFQYDAHWLQHGFDLAPQLMTFDVAPQLAKSPIFQGLHGVFYDSLPDGWGLLLMDRFFKQQYGWERHEITALDKLAYLGRRAMGALEYAPALANDVISEEIQLDKIVEQAESLLTGESGEIVKELRILGGSPGGARPKITLALADDSDKCVAGLSILPAGFTHWLVKFHSMTDPADMGRIEKAYADIAELAGISMPPSRLIQVVHADKQEEVFFAVKRFDRVGGEKRHMLTLGGYLYADFRLPALDYDALLAATAVMTKDMREVARAFRLMVFNVVMHNKDDHAKNFAFLCDREGRWKLAPGYDFTFSAGMANEHTTAINGSGNPDMRDIAAVAQTQGVQDWEKIVMEVRTAAKQWQFFAKKYQVSPGFTDQITLELKKIDRRLKQ